MTQKVKRKIAPVLVVEEKANLSSAPKQSVVYEEFLKKASAPSYIADLEERAVKLGYSKAKKARKPRKPKEVGKHAEFLNSFADYALEFLRLHKHRKETYYSYLKKHFDKGEYYSDKSKRFRKVR